MHAHKSTPDQRDVILAAAIDILGSDGASALTVRNVATMSGCSTTGVYTYFGGKGGLVEAIFVQGFDSFDQALAEAERSGDLLSAGMSYRRWALDNPTHYLVMFGRAVPDFEPSETASLRAMQSFEQLVDMVAKVVDDDRSAAELTELAFHVWATVHGYVMLELLGMAPPHVADADHLYAQGLERLRQVFT